MTEHPITPPPELLDQWLKIPEIVTTITKMAVVTVTTNRLQMLATEAARWGADVELEACCEWLNREVGTGWGHGTKLRAARRPKPPSLKEQALADLAGIPIDPENGVLVSALDNIRHALESLPD